MFPRISVIITCFNLGAYLREAVDSVLTQTLRRVEIIVVNDGSTDPETLQVLNELSKEAIIVVHTHNQGLPAARNEGIRRARSNYIVPLDADDRIAPTYLERAVDILDRDSNVGIVYGGVELFGETQGPWPQPEFSVQTILFENMIVASAVFRRVDWIHVGGYRQTMVYGWEDWDLWLSFLELGRTVVRISDVMFFYRIRGRSMTGSMTASQKLRMFFTLVRQHKGLYLYNWKAVLRRCLRPGYRLIASPR